MSKLAGLIEAGDLTEFEAHIIESYPPALKKLEEGEADYKRCLRVAKAWQRAELRRGPHKHHTRYHPKIIEAIQQRIGHSKRILDPMAGTFERLRELERYENGWHQTHGIELENEWVIGYPHPRLRQGDARDLPFDNEYFDCVVVSPSYGNRDSDKTGDWWDNDDRLTYAAALRRNVSANSLCQPFDNPVYKSGHTHAWAESTRVLKTGGMFFINLKNHIKAGRIIPVSQWHREILRDILKYVEIDDAAIPTPGRFSGANSGTRAEFAEKLYVFRKSESSHTAAMSIIETLRPGRRLDNGQLPFKEG